MDWEELYGDFYGYGDDPDGLVVRPNCVALGFEGDFEDGGGPEPSGDDFSEDREGWDFEEWEDGDGDGEEDGDGCYAENEEDF